jgi:hypothetical protein
MTSHRSNCGDLTSARAQPINAVAKDFRLFSGLSGIKFAVSSRTSALLMVSGNLRPAAAMLATSAR